jgi:hypothetical protein
MLVYVVDFLCEEVWEKMIVFEIEVLQRLRQPAKKRGDSVQARRRMGRFNRLCFLDIQPH